MHAFKAIRFSGHTRWRCIVKLCWEDLPDLSIFSAMRVLQWVVPQKALYDLNDAIWYKDKDSGWYLWVWGIVFWFLSRPAALVVGMDCFLMKYRTTERFIMTTDSKMGNIIAAVVFLNQILGVANIRETLKSRLYRFVFAGEDGIMTLREFNRLEVWEAMVVRTIFTRYPVPKAFALVMTWCDDDFQMMALNDVDRNRGKD